MQILSKSWKGESVLQLMQSDARGSLIIQGAGCMLWAYTWFMSYSDHCKKHILLGFPLNYLVFLIKSLIRKLESPRNAVFTFISLSYMLKNTRHFLSRAADFQCNEAKLFPFTDCLSQMTFHLNQICLWLTWGMKSIQLVSLGLHLCLWWKTWPVDFIILGPLGLSFRLF